MSRGEVTFLFHMTDKSEKPIQCSFFERFPNPQDETQVQEIILDALLEVLEDHRPTKLKCITAVVDFHEAACRCSIIRVTDGCDDQSTRGYRLTDCTVLTFA